MRTTTLHAIPLSSELLWIRNIACAVRTLHSNNVVGKREKNCLRPRHKLVFSRAEPKVLFTFSRKCENFAKTILRANLPKSHVITLCSVKNGPFVPLVADKF
jgi:hypothetical protein